MKENEACDFKKLKNDLIRYNSFNDLFIFSSIGPFYLFLFLSSEYNPLILVASTL